MPLQRCVKEMRNKKNSQSEKQRGKSITKRGEEEEEDEGGKQINFDSKAGETFERTLSINNFCAHISHLAVVDFEEAARYVRR